MGIWQATQFYLVCWSWRGCEPKKGLMADLLAGVDCKSSLLQFNFMMTLRLCGGEPLWQTVVALPFKARCQWMVHAAGLCAINPRVPSFGVLSSSSDI